MIKFPVAALTISVCLVVLLFTAGESLALPPCQGDDESKWQNCEGTLADHRGEVDVGHNRKMKLTDTTSRNTTRLFDAGARKSTLELGDDS